MTFNAFTWFYATFPPFLNIWLVLGLNKLWREWTAFRQAWTKKIVAKEPLLVNISHVHVLCFSWENHHSLGRNDKHRCICSIYAGENMSLLGENLPGVKHKDLPCKEVSPSRTSTCMLPSQSGLGEKESREQCSLPLSEIMDSLVFSPCIVPCFLHSQMGCGFQLWSAVHIHGGLEVQALK